MNTPISALPTHPDEPADDPIFWAPSRAFLKLSIAFTVAGCIAFEMALLAFAPEQTTRALGALALVVVAAVAWVQVSGGRLKAAALTLGLGEWVIVTVFLAFFGGVHGAATILYPMIILMAGWMFSTRAAVGVAIATSVVTLGFVIGEAGGALAPAPPTSSTMRWVVQCFVYFLSAALVPYVVRAYRKRLEEVRALGNDLGRRTVELQASETDLHRAQAVAHIGSWVYDLAADRIRLSAETCRIFGLPEGTSGSHGDYLSRTHPDDRAALDIAWKSAVARNVPFDREHRIVAGNEVRWVRQIAQFEAGPDGRAARAVGTTQDVTERRLAVEALRLTRIGVDSTSDAMYWIAPDATFVDVNPAACGMLGYSREALIALKVADIDASYGPQDWAAHFADLRARGSMRFESEHLTRDGRRIPVEIACNYIRIGSEDRACAVVRDITERKHQAAEVLAARNQLAATLDAIPDLLFEVDLEGRYLDYRAPDVGMLAAPPDQLIGRTVMDVLPPAAANTCMAALREAFETGRSHGRQIALPLPQGQLWFELSVARKTVGSGQGPRLIVLSRDITARKSVEDALRRREVELQCVLGATADGILAVDQRGKVLHANPRFAQLWRIPQSVLDSRDDEALLEQVLRQLADPEAFLEKVQALYSSEAEVMDTVLFKDGRVFERFSSPLVLNGVPSGRVWSFRDVTQGRAAAQALAESEQRLRDLVNTSSDWFWEQDAQFRFTSLSEGLRGVVPFEKYTSIGKRRWELPLLAGVSEEGWEEHRRTLERHEAFHDFVYQRQAGDGSLRWFSVSGTPVFLPDGTFNGYRGTARDITERAAMDQRLRQTQKMEAVGLLAGGIAHDFNNVLAAIRAGVQLSKSELSEGHAAAVGLDQIEKSTARALELVRQILTFSRGQDNVRTAQDISSAVQGAVQVMRAALPASIDIRTSFSPELPQVVTNTIAIHQVIMNLAVNAAHAMGDAGRLDIEVRAVDVDDALAAQVPGLKRGRSVCLTVRDSGCGMDAATLTRIFEPFFSTKTQQQGTGLGLSVVHGIVREHGGAISVRSAPGEGAEFRIYFPALAHVVHMPAEPGAAPAASRSGQGERLLFVDDEADLVFLSKLLLEKMGYRVQTCVNSEEALAEFSRDPSAYDAMITDLSMPGMSGLELARRVLELRPGFPVIVMSGHIRDVDAQRAQALGIGELHWKPNTVEDLADTLRRRISGNQR